MPAADCGRTGCRAHLDRNAIQSLGGSMMLTAHPSSFVQKRDLHVGGLGLGASGALAARAQTIVDAADSWVDRLRTAAIEVDDYVHDNPWAALALVALVGAAAGYLLSR